MKVISRLGSVFALITVLTLGACASRNATNVGVVAPAKFYSGIGVVQSIKVVSQEAGAVAPAVATSDRTSENKPRQSASVYKFSVHMDDDSDKTIMQNTDGGFEVGDCVQVHNAVLQRCGHRLGD
jgi:hypothetical protein